MRVLFVFIAFSLNLLANESSEEWLSHWMTGTLFVKEKKFNEAIVEYTQSIEILEREDRLQDQLYIFNNRGEAYLLSDQYACALADFRIVRESQVTSLTDKIMSQWGIARTYARLGDLENFIEQFQKVREIDPNYPKVEVTREYIIFRNFHSDSPCVRKNFAKTLVKINLCKREGDVIFTNNGICMVKRSDENRACQVVGRINQSNNEQNCKYWCDRIANTALMVCSSRFSGIMCITACSQIVESLRQGCFWCCEGEGFYERCVKPFEDYLIRVPCDPEWD